MSEDKQRMRKLLKETKENIEECKALAENLQSSIVLCDFESIYKRLKDYENVHRDDKYHHLTIKTECGDIVIGVRYDNRLYMESPSESFEIKSSEDHSSEEIVEHVMQSLEKLNSTKHKIHLEIEINRLSEKQEDVEPLLKKISSAIKLTPVSNVEATVNSITKPVLVKKGENNG